MSEITQDQSSSVRSYLVGFGLALLLTAIPFVVVLFTSLTKPLTLSVIAVAAVIQILVHLRYFLHLNFSPSNRWFLVTIAFTTVILVIMVGGSIWIIIDLNRHMMPMP
ncbi:MAG: cytochrome o ubiquinol oxidase subunit IV [Candidatus Thiodiazotropha sp.]